MSPEQPRVIELEEYVPRKLPRGEIPERLGESLWRNYSSQVTVDFPSPKTDWQWKLTSQGWVGHIPVSEEFGLVLQPKVELGNLFRMLEYAYHLDLKILQGVFESQSLREFYERLANILAQRVLDRSRKGFYRAYLSKREQLPFVRGRVDVRQLAQTPWDVNLRCHYQEHTADVNDNQILAWTLYSIARSGMCTERVQPTVRQAYRSLRDMVELVPHGPQACVGRLYNRLNDDYQPLHALCRFFLEHSGPRHERGDYTMLPFLINMERLYELFVAEWLKAQLPGNVELRIQDPAERGTVQVDIDLVLYDTQMGAARCVLDTKYKAPRAGPSNRDIAQVHLYAAMKDCNQAILIYPTPLAQPLDEWFKGTHVHSMTFSLDGDIEQNGQTFLANLGVALGL